MKQKVYFEEKEEYFEIGITENEVLERYYRLPKDFLTGAIFIGKVIRASKQTGAFVDIGKEKDGLMPFRMGLRPGDTVLVNVTKEETEEKGCALEEGITLSGRFAVLTEQKEYKFSRHIDENKKNELCSIEKHDRVGFVFRSACMYAQKDEIESECNALYKKYFEIKNRAKNEHKIVKLYSQTAEQTARNMAYSDEAFFIGTDAIEKQIKTIGERKVTKENVELVFDKTEALTAVDVNIKNFSKEYSDSDTRAFQANVVAIKELARQLRLRNIGGITVVDVISLRDKRKFKELEEILKEELKKDHVKTEVEAIESIGMFAVVRKKRYFSV